MNPGEIKSIEIDDRTFAEVAELAVAANVAIVERAGKMAFCGVDTIPPGWSRVAVREKVEA